MRAILILTASCAVLALATGAGQTREASKAVAHTSVAVGKSKVRERCRSAEKAIVFYRKKVWFYQDALGDARNPTRYPERRKNACDYKRFVVTSWRGQARQYRLEYNNYLYHYAWWLWLPDKFQRVGACETGYGKKPGSFTWDSGTYVSAFGIYRPAFNQFAGYAGITHWPDKEHPGPIPTPREQYIVASGIQARFGWSAWGCGGA